MTSILAAAAMLAACTPAVALAAADSTPLPIVIQRTLQRDDSRAHWHFRYHYPRIESPAAGRGPVEMFNRQMRQQAEASLEAFKKEVVQYGSAAGPGDGKSEHLVNYTVVTRTPPLLAIKFVQSTYFRGAAHPLAAVFTRNFAMTGRFLKLEDLFLPHSDYLQRIATEVQRQITAQAKQNDFKIIEPGGYAADAKNFQSFVITRRGLEFFLDPYQVAPGYVGILSATVPWSLLEPMLSDRARTSRQ